MSVSGNPPEPKPPERAFHQLKASLRQKARELGFTLFGVVPPQPLPQYQRYLAWLQAGYHADMTWIATPRAQEARRDPRSLLPECKSILVLGIPYWNPESLSPPEQGGPYGRVAAYAWGRDYHRVLPKRLRKLVRYLEELVGEPIPHRVYTDAGPLLETELAQQAGLGWEGRHTLLIHPRLGSYFFLAEILLGLELPPDPPFPADYCGTCTRCLEACPTQCILPEGMVDASRCISYLTIENRGAIPEALRPALGQWVFGCDICQMVCPWNRRFAPPQGDPAFAPRPGQAFLRLEDLLSMDEETFVQRFQGTPLRRAKRSGLARNAAVALGNARDPNTVPVLAQALHQDPDPIVREHAAWALGRIATPEAHQALQQALATETHPQVRESIQRALSAGVAPPHIPHPQHAPGQNRDTSQPAT